MNEPKRWLDDPGSAPPELRELLAAAEAPRDLPEALRERTAGFVAGLARAEERRSSVRWMAVAAVFATATLAIVGVLATSGENIDGGATERTERTKRTESTEPTARTDEATTDERTFPGQPPVQTQDVPSPPSRAPAEPEGDAPSTAPPARVRRASRENRLPDVFPEAERGRPSPPDEEPPSERGRARLSAAEMARVVHDGRPRLQRCWEAERTRGATARVEVTIDIAPSGAVASASVRGDGSPALHACVAGAVERFRLPSSDESGRATFPIVFRSDDPNAAGRTDAGTGEGTLVINTVPWSRLFVDGRDTGMNTPIRGLSVPAGDHELVFQTEDGTRHRLRVHVDAGETLRIARRFD